MIRVENQEDYRVVENITREAFWNLYCEGADEHLLLHVIRNSPSFIPELSLVVEEEGALIAHIAYSRSRVVYQDGKQLQTITFGPVSVDPSRQCKGVGSSLIRQSIEKARSMGFKCIIIQGYPSYYHRFGFKCTKQANICSPDSKFYLATMFLELQPGYLTGELGVFEIADQFNLLTQQELEVFEEQFPPKQKYPTVSQAVFSVVSKLEWDEELPTNAKDAQNRAKIG